MLRRFTLYDEVFGGAFGKDIIIAGSGEGAGLHVPESPGSRAWRSPSTYAGL